MIYAGKHPTIGEINHTEAELHAVIDGQDLHPVDQEKLKEKVTERMDEARDAAQFFAHGTVEDKGGRK